MSFGSMFSNIVSQIGSSLEGMQDIVMSDAPSDSSFTTEKEIDKSETSREIAPGEPITQSSEMVGEIQNERKPNKLEIRNPSPQLPSRQVVSVTQYSRQPLSERTFRTRTITPGDAGSRQEAVREQTEDLLRVELAKQRDENGVLQAQLQRSEQELRQYSTQLLQVRREEQHRANDRLQQSITLYERRIAECARKIDDYDRRLGDSYRNHTMEVREIRKDADARIKQGEDFANALKEDKRAIEGALDGYELQINALESQIKTMQEGALRSVEAAQWAPMAASDVERNLKMILSSVKQWSEKHSKLPISEVLSHSRFERLGHILTDKGCIHTPKNVHEALAKNKTMQKTGKASALLLAAAVSSDMFHRIIGDPLFAFVGKTETAGVLQDQHRSAIENLLERIEPADKTGAYALRCQLLRLLDPPSNDANPEVVKIKAFAAESRKAAARNLAEECIQDVADILIPKAETDAARAGLEAVALQAAELSWRLWTRRTNLEVLDMKNLNPPSKAGILPFSHASSTVEAHPLHTASMEDDPACMDGREVLVLCSPAVRAAGTAEGQDYHKTRLWRKAVAWLG